MWKLKLEIATENHNHLNMSSSHHHHHLWILCEQIMYSFVRNLPILWNTNKRKTFICLCATQIHRKNSHSENSIYCFEHYSFPFAISNIHNLLLLRLYTKENDNHRKQNRKSTNCNQLSLSHFVWNEALIEAEWMPACLFSF